MDLRLIVESGARRGVYRLRSSVAVIGRGRGNSVRIPSADVSRRHCRLTVQDERLWVEDLGSVNGTLLNGRRIQGIEAVRPGDELTVGPVTFLVEYKEALEALDELEPLDELQEIEEIEEIRELDEIDEPLPVDDDDLLPWVESEE